MSVTHKVAIKYLHFLLTKLPIHSSAVFQIFVLNFVNNGMCSKSALATTNYLHSPKCHPSLSPFGSFRKVHVSFKFAYTKYTLSYLGGFEFEYQPRNRRD